jgi:hypothetical protein
MRRLIQLQFFPGSLKPCFYALKVILIRELKSCPFFSNLKTLSLGEWCVGADFNALVSFLQHSPNLETLFLELKLVWQYVTYSHIFFMLFT